MQDSINYIMEHLDGEITLQDLCSKANYSEAHFVKKFKEYYGQSWERFITMLRMRRAAKELLEDDISVSKLSEKYGFYGSNTFNKAFKREIGISPREFRKSRMNIPEMPIPETIHGKKLFRHYVRMEDKTVYGRAITLNKSVKDIDRLYDCAYPLEYRKDLFKFRGALDQIGFWWSEAEDEMYYVLGTEAIPQGEEGTQENDDIKKFTLPGTGYVMFSIEISDTLEETLLAHRAMVYYVMMVWQMINHKVGNTMLYTFEEFTKNYTRLWLPLYKGMPGDEMIDSQESNGVDSFIPYIDQHVTTDLSMENMAAYYNYSERHLRRTIKIHYELSLAELIKKRRLYLAAGEISQTEDELEKMKIARKYQFRNIDSFQKQFEEEFHTDSDNYQEASAEIFNPADYISKYKDMIWMKCEYIDELKMIGTVLHANDTKNNPIDDMDIPELAAYWMKHDSDELKYTPFRCNTPGKEDKIGVWIEDVTTKRNEYILGPVVSDFTDIPENFLPVTLAAGNYVVFESRQDSDEENLAEVYRMFKRFTSFDWFKKEKNLARYNYNKLTFFRYHDRKLYYYVPVYR